MKMISIVRTSALIPSLIFVNQQDKKELKRVDRLGSAELSLPAAKISVSHYSVYLLI